MLEHFICEATSVCSLTPRLGLPSDVLFSGANPSGSQGPLLVSGAEAAEEVY